MKDEIRKKVEKEYPQYRPDKRRMLAVLKRETRFEKRQDKKRILFENVKILRVKNGLKLRVVGKQLGYSGEYIRQIESIILSCPS